MKQNMNSLVWQAAQTQEEVKELKKVLSDIKVDMAKYQQDLKAELAANMKNATAVSRRWSV